MLFWVNKIIANSSIYYSNIIHYFSHLHIIYHLSSFQVLEKLTLAMATGADIDSLRDGYRPVAKRGAILFFVLSDMATVNTMYQYSLSAYLEVFAYSLKKAMPNVILMKRLRNIINMLTKNVYDYGCTGKMFELVETVGRVIEFILNWFGRSFAYKQRLS